MTEPRTVTMPTLHHGLITIPEPDWCIGHDLPHIEHRIDISHVGPTVSFDVPTSRGEVVTMLAALEQRPFTARHPGTGVFMNVELCGDDWYPSSPAQLDQLADALVGHAAQLRALARQLAVLCAGEGL